MNIQTPFQILSSEHFDTGTKTAVPTVHQQMKAVLAEAKATGLDILDVCRQAKEASRADACDHMLVLHDTAALLFIQWQRARQTPTCPSTLALARLFNGVTRAARELHEKYELLDQRHIRRLHKQLQGIDYHSGFDPQEVAKYMDEAARAHTHDGGAWAWVVLPTFARQQYGRILLTKVDIPGIEHPVVVTQPFFLGGKCTLFHTHGQNWAFSRPLGNPKQSNAHLNSLWMPREGEEPFPLDLVELAAYDNDCVAIVPPRLIHGISRKRCQSREIPTMTELLADPGRCQSWIDQTKFGEMSCLHIYCPHVPLVHKFNDCPLVKAEEDFFIEYDMIVFDHYKESIWCGGGGSWPLRMMSYGATGEHCGACFVENDPRKENLDPQTVAQWFVQDPPPALIRYEGSKT